MLLGNDERFSCTVLRSAGFLLGVSIIWPCVRAQVQINISIKSACQHSKHVNNQNCFCSSMIWILHALSVSRFDSTFYTHSLSQKALAHQAFHLVFSWLSWFLSFKVLLTFVLWVADKRVTFILSLLRGKGKGVVLELTGPGVSPPSSFQPQFWVSQISFYKKQYVQTRIL